MVRLVEGILFDNNVDQKAAIAYCKARRLRYVVTPINVGENKSAALCGRILHAGATVQMVFLENERFQQEKLNSPKENLENRAIIRERWSRCNDLFDECAEGFKRLLTDSRTKPAFKTLEGIETLYSLASSPRHQKNQILRINLLSILKLAFPLKTRNDSLGTASRCFWNDLTSNNHNKWRAAFYDAEHIRYAKTFPGITLCTEDEFLAEIARQLGLAFLDPSDLT